MFENLRFTGDFTLSSGLKSNVYYNFDLLLPDDVEYYAKKLVREHDLDSKRFSFVACPAYGGILLAFCVAKELGLPLIIIEKNGDRRGDLSILGPEYLIVDDVISGFNEVKKVQSALRYKAKAVASYIFRGENNPLRIPLFFLELKEKEEPKEIWRPIKGFTKSYQVSNFGRVRSIDRVVISKNKVKKSLKGKLLSILYDGQGYPQANLRRDKRVLIHTLVLNEFIGPRPLGWWARHLDGNKKNNNINNLTWDDPSTNQLDKLIHGTHRSKLKPKDIKDIRTLYKLGFTYREIAEKYSVWPSTIGYIIKGKTWRHIQDD